MKQNQFCTGNVITAVLSILAGIAAGFLFPAFSANYPAVFLISFILGFFVFVYLMLNTLTCQLIRNCRMIFRKFLPLLSFGVIGLLITSVTGLLVAGTPSLFSQILFGINAAFFVFLLLSCLRFVYSVYLFGHDGADRNKNS